MKIVSPCINLCSVDSRGVCLGCFRTLAEIARWSKIDDRERTSIMAVLAKRRLAGAQPASDPKSNG